MSDFLEVIGEMKEAADRDTDNLEAARLRNQLYLWVERLEAALAQQAGAVATGEVRARTDNGGRGMNITQYFIDLGCDMDHNPIGRNMVGSRFALSPIASSGPGGGGEVCTCPSGDGSLRWPCPQHPADSNVESVRAKLLDRSRVGIAKYGATTVDAGLTRHDWLNHLQQELMDGAVYCEAAMQIEGKS